ncbi:MAG: cation:proton antiporter, partial [Anaerolineae bacterium]|nr:cation:proton antiporter [Anaerolineae bacterium]
GLMIGAAQLAGTAARSIGQPRVFGELLAGVILGPTLLDLLHWGVFDDPELLGKTLEEFAELGVLFLMFTVGLEVHLKELLNVGKVALWGGVFGAVLPIAMAIPVVLVFDFDIEAALFVGVVLAATSVSISAQTMLELGVLRTKEGLGLLATAVIDDILAILLLSVVIATLGSEESASAVELIWIFVKMMLYLGGAMAVAWFALPPLFNWIHHNRQFASGTASFALIMALFFGWSADVLGGVAAITGAFIAGMGLSQTNERAKFEIVQTVRHISYSFLVPIFFVNVGLHIDLKEVGGDMIPFALLLIVVAAISKVVGSGVGARLGGFTNGESFRLGICMISRGEVGLIIATLGLANGLLDSELFEPLFLVILVTTVMTPPLVRWVFRDGAATPLARVPGTD